MADVAFTADREVCAPWLRPALAPRGVGEGLVEETHFDVCTALSAILKAFTAAHGGEDLAGVRLIEAAYHLAVQAHTGQLRTSGVAYVSHPVMVARIVAELGLDAETVAAALCHDVVEDTALSSAHVVAALTPAAGSQRANTVGVLVEGVTKMAVTKTKASSHDQIAAASLRKLLVAVASDVRCLIIKLADRLTNIRTLDALEVSKRQRIAQETLEVYAPLAHRLGMSEIKAQLEDGAFAHLDPHRYATIMSLVEAAAPQRDAFTAELVSSLQARFAALGLQADVSGRAKHVWSIANKMRLRGKTFEDIHDLIGVRIIVAEVAACYTALGVVHQCLHPVPGSLRDHIASPKFNLYQSLHSTCVAPGGRVVEVQIRTRDMHERAEVGVAAHWRYKHPQQSGEPPWLSRLLDWRTEDVDPHQFLAGLREELVGEEVCVLTPHGDVVSLPSGATALDFAYAIHTELGHHAAGIKVNAALVALGTPLVTGDTVEVVATREAGTQVSLDWLELVTSARAQNAIRAAANRSRRTDAQADGRTLLMQALHEQSERSYVVGEAVLEALASQVGYATHGELELALSSGKLAVHSVIPVLRDLLHQSAPAAQAPPTLAATLTRPSLNGSSDAVFVEGLDDVLVHLARCCSPIPGDTITGYLTRDRGVSVHRTTCVHSAAQERQQRLVDVEWVAHPSPALVSVELRALDRPRLLADTAEVLFGQGLMIVECSALTDASGMVRQQFSFAAADVSHVQATCAALAQVSGVYEVRRL